MENFKKYTIEDLSPEPLFIVDISWNNKGLKVSLESESGLDKIGILFDETVYLYQDTAEFCKPSWDIDSESDYYPFYYSEKSDMIDRLKEDVDHVRDDEIIHFVIIGLDDVVDVLTTDLPKIFKL
ncbi:hypothetical protein [Anaerococcus lactolyticus]|uniref:Uncharacterized protein n=1 Tax=Anaerococcus lactolyticus S7-1-13 TaxID=1284686 RepID=A0A095WZL2_9FIRM|nr:hypothetical protein [Anaerococcus lactolyticus]KGF03058.1 hypothetical protein HMPREF1630_08695 [Anaerococcus lactolyticus S7-1-13]